MRWNACCHVCERAYYFCVTLVGLFHECFAGVLPSFEYHFNSPFSTFAGVCYEVLFPSVSHCVETTSYLTFNAIQSAVCHEVPFSSVSHCVETTSYLTFNAIYIYIHVFIFFSNCYFTFMKLLRCNFFEYVSRCLFRWYVLILISLFFNLDIANCLI